VLSLAVDASEVGAGLIFWDVAAFFAFVAVFTFWVAISTAAASHPVLLFACLFNMT
jgi:hypothetical protein